MKANKIFCHTFHFLAFDVIAFQFTLGFCAGISL